MARASQTLALIGAATLLASCEVSSPEIVAQDLEALSQSARSGVSSVRDALGDPAALSRALGAGVEEVSRATRGLDRLASAPEILPEQRLAAGLESARAWDDLARALESSELHDPEPPELGRLYHELLREKAFPARIAARNGYERALRLACRLAGEDHPAVLEAQDGIERYGGQVPVPDRVCSVP